MDKSMFINITVINCNDQIVEYEWKTASEFQETMEGDVSVDTEVPMLDDSVLTFDYKGEDKEFSWNEEALREEGICTVDDLYRWTQKEL